MQAVLENIVPLHQVEEAGEPKKSATAVHTRLVNCLHTRVASTYNQCGSYAYDISFLSYVKH